MTPDFLVQVCFALLAMNQPIPETHDWPSPNSKVEIRKSKLENRNPKLEIRLLSRDFRISIFEFRFSGSRQSSIANQQSLVPQRHHGIDPRSFAGRQVARKASRVDPMVALRYE